MSSKVGVEKNNQDDVEPHVKDDKEQEIDRKIAAMREKNQQLLRRHQLKEDDRKQAELSGCAVVLHQTSSSPIRHREDEDEDWIDEKPVASTKQGGRNDQPKRLSAKERLGNRPVTGKGNASVNGTELADKEKQAGDDKRHSSQLKLVPPPDPVNRFLADPRRDNTDEGGEEQNDRAQRQQRSQRNRRNYGGENFDNVPHAMKAQRKSQRGSAFNQTKTDYQLSTTGAERREYEAWKTERDRIDNERIQRQKQADGHWRREWDAQKIDQQSSDGTSASVVRRSNRGSGSFLTQDQLESSSTNNDTNGRGRGQGRGKPGAAGNSVGSPQAEVGTGCGRGIMKYKKTANTSDVNSKPADRSAEVDQNRSVNTTTEPIRALDAGRQPASKDSRGHVQSEKIWTSPISGSTAEFSVPEGLPSSEDIRKTQPSASNNPSQPPLYSKQSSGGRRRPDLNSGQKVVETLGDKLFIQVGSQLDERPSAPVVVSAKSPAKSPKIGSGRLAVDSGNARARSGGQVSRKNFKKSSSSDRYERENPVLIGMTVIRTPGDELSDPAATRKGILKPSKHVPMPASAADAAVAAAAADDDEYEDVVVDWDKEIQEAEKRKALEEPSKARHAVRQDVKKSDTHGSKLGKSSHKISPAVDSSTGRKGQSPSKPQVKDVSKKGTGDDDDVGGDDDDWEDVDEEFEDAVEGDDNVDDEEEENKEEMHDVSSESFEQFIKENTLKVDIDCTPNASSNWSSTGDPVTPGSQSDSSFLKTPTGVVHIPDWGAEMDALSDHEPVVGECKIIETSPTDAVAAQSDQSSEVS